MITIKKLEIVLKLHNCDKKIRFILVVINVFDCSYLGYFADQAEVAKAKH
jgi:hypothetical protein